MTTLYDVIADVRRLLLSGIPEERNKLSSGLTGSGTSASLLYPLGSIDRGTKLSLALEDMYVWSKDSQTVTLERAIDGSVLSDHSAGDIVYVNPRFSNYEIFDALNKELLALSSPANGLFGVQDYELTYNPIIQGYDFPYPVLDIYQVRYTIPGPSREWWISQNWEYTRHSGDEFGSDNALFIRDAFPNQAVVVKTKVAFNTFPASLTADIADTLLPESCYDILSLGAAVALSSPREIRRNFTETQGDTRRANEVPPGANLGGARELARQRQQRINEEAARLSQQYPSHSPRFPFVVGGY